MSDEVTVTMSATIGAIGAALAKAQLEMRPAIKDAENPHFRNRYASLASCVEALHPLHANGIAVIQPPALHGLDGVCVTTLLIHSSGEWIRGELYMPASKRDPQGFGSALSYARRYCLTATVGLATDDDDGEGSSRGSKASPRNGSGGGGQRPASARGASPGSPAPRAEAANDDGQWLEWALIHTVAMKNAQTAGELRAAFSTAWREAEVRNAPVHIRESLKKCKNDLKAVFPAEVSA